jgi:hypothetical protein
MVAVAAVGIALGVSRWSPIEIFHAYELSFLGLIGLSPILICYLWLRQSPDHETSVSIEGLVGKFAVVLAVGFLFWVMIAVWADP